MILNSGLTVDNGYVLGDLMEVLMHPWQPIKVKLSCIIFRKSQCCINVLGSYTVHINVWYFKFRTLQILFHVRKSTAAAKLHQLEF